MKTVLQLAISTTMGLFTLIGSANAIPYCRACPNSCADLGLGKKDCSNTAQARGLCCVDLSNKGLSVAQEQERALAQAAPTKSESCPTGFQPSEQRCSDKERKHGCKDMRLPSGLGCVRR